CRRWIFRARWLPRGRAPKRSVCASMTRSSCTPRTGSPCASCRAMCWPGSPTWHIRPTRRSRWKWPGGSPQPTARWPRSRGAWRRAPTRATASRSRCGPTTNPPRRRTSRRPSSRTRSRGCMPVCGGSTCPRRTSRIGSRRRSNSLATAPVLRSSPRPTGRSSAPRCAI
ncbi:MAG: hypothetical protein AVDCRST_MAG13-3625, partial [uncultured Solirubrobacteraceae bacterium]